MGRPPPQGGTINRECPAPGSIKNLDLSMPSLGSYESGYGPTLRLSLQFIGGSTDNICQTWLLL
jgi:hypothetical protein